MVARRRKPHTAHRHIPGGMAAHSRETRSRESKGFTRRPARATTTTDKAVRGIEDPLYATDGGRVILKAVRAPGGWERWGMVPRVPAVVRAAEGSPAPPAAGGAPAAVPERQLAWTVPSP